MKAWEIDVELRVRKTLVFSGPATEAAAREIAELALKGQIPLHTLQKKTPRGSGWPEPVEENIDNAPAIVAVRQVEEP
jgi:hypothetical protein